MGMVQARPTGRLTETVELPRGTRFLLSPENGSPALCRTLTPLRILPVSLTQARILLRPDRGYCLAITFESMYPRSDAIGNLRLAIDHLNNYQASLVVFDALKTHFKEARVLFDEKPDEESKGEPCPLCFGNDAVESELRGREMPPLQESRFFFHFPWQELAVTIDVPPPKKSWRRFSILMDLAPGWPGKLTIHPDIFRLHTVAVENLTQEASPPIVYQGTKERFLIRHPDPDQGFALQSIRGVYKVQDGGMVPLRAGILSGGEGSYEIEQKTEPHKGTRHWLCLHYSGAFSDPVTLVVDGLWHQPGFSALLSQQTKAAPYTRNITGVNWELCENMAGAMETVFQDSMDEFMHLLTIKNKPILDVEDVFVLLDLLGSVWPGNFRPVKELFYGIRVEQTARDRRLDLVYHLKFKACEPGQIPLVKTFTRKVGKILDTWISDARILTRMEMDEK